MNDYNVPSAPPSRPSTMRLLFHVWTGMVFYGLINFLLSFWYEGGSAAVVVPIFAASVIALAAVAYVLLKWRGFAAGLLVGYGLMTIVSGGACTGFSSNWDGVIQGLVLYVLAVLLFGLGLGITEIITELRG